jgi:putative Mn2+ efflux pump MntP
MVAGGLGGEQQATAGPDPSKGATMVLLSIATSLDALAVGLTLAMLGVGILVPALIIGLVTGGLCTLGVSLGARLGQRFGRHMSVAGGLVLVAIGAKILVEHLTA